MGAAWRTTVDAEQQRALAGELEALIAAELPFAVLFYEDGIYAYRAAAYDGWAYQKGQGIFTKLSFLPAARP
jgi:peptide/nickel transport system substrate-binding protein